MVGAALIALILASGDGQAAETVRQGRTRLVELQKQLDDSRAELRNMASEEHSIAKAFFALDGRIDELLALQADAEKAAVALVHEQDQLNAEIAKRQAELVDLEARVQDRLRSIVASERGATLRNSLGIGSFVDTALTRHLQRRLSQTDVALIKRTQTLRASLDDRAAALASARENSRQLEEDLEQQRVTLDMAKETRRDALKTLRQNRELRLKAIRDNVKEQRAVKNELYTLLRKRPGQRRRGDPAFRWPVAGPLLRSFGVSRDKVSRAKIVSNGIHIRAKRGSTLRAPESGTVVHSGSMRGFGRLVLIAHGQGYHSLLAHLSRIDVSTGDVVDKGQVIGAVGDSGSVEGAKLYFEVRKKGRPVDPLRYLPR